MSTLNGAMRTTTKLEGIRKKVYIMSALAKIYGLWYARNEVLWHNKLPCVDNMVKRIVGDIKNRNFCSKSKEHQSCG